MKFYRPLRKQLGKKHIIYVIYYFAVVRIFRDEKMFAHKNFYFRDT
jgi:hypothetical protein